jgi:hypothetical protein
LPRYVEVLIQVDVVLFHALQPLLQSLKLLLVSTHAQSTILPDVLHFLLQGCMLL